MLTKYIILLAFHLDLISLAGCISHYFPTGKLCLIQIIPSLSICALLPLSMFSEAVPPSGTPTSVLSLFQSYPTCHAGVKNPSLCTCSPKRPASPSSHFHCWALYSTRSQDHLFGPYQVLLSVVCCLSGKASTVLRNTTSYRSAAIIRD